MDIKDCLKTDQYKRIQGAKLKVQNKTFSVYKGVNTIGRNKTAIINLKNLNVSQQQAVIVIIDDIQHFIGDLNSSNGTYLFDTKLAPFKLYELSNEMEIKFGDVVTTYLKMPKLTTVHLETESMEMTQNMTQNFYAATTQLMFDNMSLNQTRLSNLPHQNISNKDTQDIHEAPTQVVEYPSTITDIDVETCNVVVETVNDDIHNALTQVVILSPKASTSKASQEQILEATIPQSNTNQKNEEDIHEMATQVVLLSSEKNYSNNQKQVEEKCEFPPPALEENSPKSAISIAKSDISNELHNPEVDESFSIIERTAIEDTVLEETEENIKKINQQAVVNENSNDSMDFLTIQEPHNEEIKQFNNVINETDDKSSTFSDSDIEQPKKRIPRKLSSSDDVFEMKYNENGPNSESETDIEDADTRKLKKKKLQKLSSKDSTRAQTTSKICNSDSETDIEDDSPRKNAKHTEIDPSDSETDIEDEVLLSNLNLTQSDDIVKPKILSKKQLFNSESESDIEDDKKQQPLSEAAEDRDSNATEILNDTDCIPATQDTFVEMFQYKNSKLSGHNSQNASSEESFKLGLTELMIDGEENNHSINEQSKTSHIVEKEKENNIHMMPTQKINEEVEYGEQHKSKDIHKLAAHNENDLPNMDINVVKCTDESLYMMPTQKIHDEVKSDTQKSVTKDINDLKCIPSTSKVASNIEKEPDDMYMMPTQKLDEVSQKFPMNTINALSSTPSTSKMVMNMEKEADDDLYMMPTQEINDYSHKFKAPAKKFTFKKKETNLEGSLTNILGNKEEEDPYLMATQKVDETEGNNEDDIYMQPTQKLENNSERENPQKTQGLEDKHKHNLNSIGPNASETKKDEAEEDLYMAPTQQINENLISDDNELYMLETQKVESQSGRDTVKLAGNEPIEENLYDLPTQLLSVTDEAGEIPPSSKDALPKTLVHEAISSTKLLGVTNQNSPRRRRMKNSDIENLKRTIESEVKIDDHQIDAFVKKSLDKPEREENEDRVETLSQIAAFVKKPFENTPKYGKGSGLKIIKEEAQMQKLGKSDSEASIKMSSGSTLPKVRQYSNKKNTSKQKEEEEIDRPETLSQIEAFIKKPLDELPKSSKLSKIEETPSTGIGKQVIKETLKESTISTRMSRTRQSTKTSKEDLNTANEGSDSVKEKNINKSEGSSKVSNADPNVIPAKKLSDTELYMLETQKIDSQSDFHGFQMQPSSDTIKADETPQNNKRPPPSVIVHEAVGDTNISKRKRTKKSDIENLKKTIDSKNKVDDDDEEIDRPETLSQIVAFIKKPLDVAPKPKKFPKIEENPPSSSKEGENGKGTVKEPGKMNDVSDFEKPKKLTRTSRARQPTKFFDEEEKNKSYLKSEGHQTKAQKPNEKPTENLEADRNVSASSIDADTIRSDIDQSFALLEAKSTKTRKSRRITNVGDIKVAACKNRRSMTTSSIPEVIDAKPTTRKSRKVTVNNNIVGTVPETKVGGKIKRIAETSTAVKRKPDTSDSDFSEPEVPTKILKVGVMKKVKGKTTVKDVDKISSAGGKEPILSTSNLRTSSRKTSSKNSEDVGSEGSGSVIDLVSTTSEDSYKGKEFATPSTSKVRATSRMTTSKNSEDSTEIGSARGPVASTPSRRGKKNIPNDVLLTTPERSKRKQRPKVVFTMLDNPQLETLIRQLGGSVVDSVDNSTVLVTANVKRSQKLLTAVGQGKPICSPDWIRASKKANEFLDPWDFILVDKEAESKWNFSLKESIAKAANERLLVNYSFQLLVSNAVDVLKGAIESCGGKCITRNPPKNAEGFYVVVASPESKSKYVKIKKQNPEVIVVEPEAVFDGVLRQELRLGRHLLT